MVEIFKTDIIDVKKANAMLLVLAERMPECKINFDLEDCDNILRVQGSFDPGLVTNVLQECGSSCELLVYLD